jgi:hypothetical protein
MDTIVQRRRQGRITAGQRLVFTGAALLVTAALWSAWTAIGEAKPTARESPSGDGIEVETGEGAGAEKIVIPLHQAGGVRYFSAGVGAEERAAAYPAFSLKLVLVAGAKAYASQVSIAIESANGTVKLEVPAEQVTGPWVFADLPDGVYRVSATKDGQVRSQAKVSIKKGATTTVYLRWPAEGP